MDMMFTNSTMDLISDVTVDIYEGLRRQSERDLPAFGPFRHGLMPVKQLKAKERFSRVYCVFLSLSNSHLIKALCTKRGKKRETEVNTPLFTTDSLRGYISVIEEAILIHLCLKKDVYLK